MPMSEPGRRETLRVRVDRRHHGAHAVDAAGGDHRDERQLVLRDHVFAKSGPKIGRDLVARHERRRRRARIDGDTAERRAARRQPIAGQAVHETKDRIPIQRREDPQRASIDVGETVPCDRDDEVLHEWRRSNRPVRAPLTHRRATGIRARSPHRRQGLSHHVRQSTAGSTRRSRRERRCSRRPVHARVPSGSRRSRRGHA